MMIYIGSVSSIISDLQSLKVLNITQILLHHLPACLFELILLGILGVK